jgi:tryptophan-rich sensory protein
MAILWTITLFVPFSKIGAALLGLYLAWVCFAGILNAAFVFLN